MQLIRYRVLAGLLLLALITYLDRVAISVASVRIRTELQLSASTWGLVLGAFALSYAIFEIPTGAMGDRLGGRQVLTRIVLWWSVFTALTGTVRAFWIVPAAAVLISIRFLFGAGEAGAFPNISAVIARWFPKHERARAIGLAWTASRAGGALSPLLIVPLQRAIGWRHTFFVLGGIGLLWCLGWFTWYRDHPSDFPKMTSAERDEIGETPEISQSHRLPWSRVLRQRNYILILLMYFTYCWGSYFYISWMPTYLQEGRGFSETQMSIWATLPFLLSGSSNFLGGWISDALISRIGLKDSRRYVGSIGLLLGGILLAAAAAIPLNWLAAVMLAAGYGFMDAMLPVSWALCVDIGGRFSGAVSGSMNTAGQVGSFLSSVGFGYAVEALQHRHFSTLLSYSIPIYPLAAMLIVSAVLFSRIDATQPLSLTERPS